MATARPVLEDLPFCLARTTLSFRRFNDQTLRAVGLQELAPGYAIVLHAVEEAGGSTVNHLVEKTQLPNGTLTGVLDGLEKEGHVQRVRNPKDGRSWLIQLTRKGQGLCDKLQVRHRLVMSLFGEVLSERETAELTRLLARLSERMRLYEPEEGPLPKPTKLPEKAKKARVSRSAKTKRHNVTK